MTLQERLQELADNSLIDYHTLDSRNRRLVQEAADRIALDADHIDKLAKILNKLQTERDACRKRAAAAAVKHKIERNELAADKEVLLGHMTTIRNVTNDPSIASLTNVVLERMAQGGGK